MRRGFQSLSPQLGRSVPNLHGCKTHSTASQTTPSLRCCAWPGKSGSVSAPGGTGGLPAPVTLLHSSFQASSARFAAIPLSRLLSLLSYGAGSTARGPHGSLQAHLGLNSADQHLPDAVSTARCPNTSSGSILGALPSSFCEQRGSLCSGQGADPAAACQEGP